MLSVTTQDVTMMMASTFKIVKMKKSPQELIWTSIKTKKKKQHRDASVLVYYGIFRWCLGLRLNEEQPYLVKSFSK